MALTDTAIRNAKPRAKLFKMYDAKGLYIEITPKGSKRWRFRYRHPGTGKEKRLSFGLYPDVPLKTARLRRDEARVLLADGIDPSANRQMEKRKKKRSGEGTFQAVAEDWKAHHLDSKSPAHQKRTWSIITRCLLPYLGKRPLSEIDAQEILHALLITERRGRLVTAHRALQVTGQIFRHGVVCGWATIDPTLSLKGALPPSETKHMAATTDPPAVAAFLRIFDAFKGTAVVATAMRLMPLIFMRPGEIRQMRWEDVDLENAEWRYFVTKVKAHHLVPLSTQAVTLLQEIAPLTQHLPGGWVFPGARSPLSPMSDGAINAAYRRLGIDTKSELTGHGWRAIGRTLLHEELGFAPEVIELHLTHRVPDALGRAYNRTRFIEQRRKMMQVWADYLEKLKSGAEVVQLRQKQS